MVFVLLFMVIGKVVGAAKEIAVAAAYGTGPIMDGYVFLFNLLSWPSTIFSNVCFITLIPFLLRIKRRSPQELALLRREILGTTLLFGCLIALVVGGALSFALSLGITGLPLRTAQLANMMLMPMLMGIPLSTMAGFLAANLMAHGKQANTLLEGVPALCILVVVVSISSRSPTQLAWATLAGFFLQVVLLFFAQPFGERAPRPLLTWRSPSWRDLSRGIGVVLAGVALPAFTEVVDQIMVAPLGAGANATLGYANRVISLLLGLGVTTIGRALLPTLSDVGSQHATRAQRIASSWAAALFLGGVMLGFVAWLFAPWGIKALFERGAFSPRDTADVVSVFRLGLFQLPFYFSGVVMAQLIASRRDYRKFLYIGIINLVTKITGNILLIPILGVDGAMVATSIMYAIACPTLWFFARL